jgi:hypothetical protein
MTVQDMISHISVLPADAEILSNSGWECDPTDIGGIWYNPQLNEVHLTQGGEYQKEYGYKPGFKCIWNYVDDETD